jgi:hypothetical protein
MMSSALKMKTYPRVFLIAVVSLSSFFGTATVHAQARTVNGVNLQRIADGVLSLMGYSLTPDVTTGSLAISSDPTGNPNIDMTVLGGGFTVSEDTPLYLEGTLGYSLYDPIFVVTAGQEERSVPTRWTTVSASGGVGWDFPIANNLKFRPIANMSYGRMTTDGSVAGFVLEELTGDEIQFLMNGEMNVLGLGGTVMLDYERYRPENEIDVELRYTNIYLESSANSSAAVQGSSDAQSVSLWARWRAPTRMSALGRPIRYVFEIAHTEFLGDLRGALGFTALSSVGTGLELDSSAHNVLVERTRLVARYLFGGSVDGVSLGLAVSF